MAELAAAGFRHAKKPESGLAYIDETYYQEYRYKRSNVLATQIRAHGIDFRNALNETPLMVAARLGRAELVAELLARGADPTLCDTAGRTALRVAIACWLDARELRPAELAAIYQALATAPIKIKVGGRMSKLDPSSIEWFLLNLCLVLYRRMVTQVIDRRSLPAFKAPGLASVLERFPAGVLAAHRTRRTYVSAALSRNEIAGTSPYNRRLFIRVAHGFYVPNPLLEIEVGGQWVSAAELMGLPLLLETIGPRADYLRRWMEQLAGDLERELVSPFAGHASAAAAPP